MELRREFFLTIGTIVLLNLCLAFGTIGLLVRMGPAITHIMENNVFSILAGEGLLAELSTAGDRSMGPWQRARIHEHLVEAKNNATRHEESVAIADIERNLPAAMEGDNDARSQAVAAIEELVRVNRDSMERADSEAQRLGRAGAWAAVFISFFSFLLSIVAVLRIQRRFLQPLAELHDVLKQARQGNHFRRCNLSDAPREVIQVMDATNQLLDERLQYVRQPAFHPPSIREINPDEP